MRNQVDKCKNRRADAHELNEIYLEAQLFQMPYMFAFMIQKSAQLFITT